MCQAEKCEKSVVMWPVKSEEDVWLKKTAMKSIGLNKNSKAIICENTDSKSQVSKIIVVPDYRFFEKRQSIHMRSVCKSRSHKFHQKIPSSILKTSK